MCSSDLQLGPGTGTTNPEPRPHGARTGVQDRMTRTLYSYGPHSPEHSHLLSLVWVRGAGGKRRRGFLMGKLRPQEGDVGACLAGIVGLPSLWPSEALPLFLAP